MTNPYSEDLRERALAKSDAGETDRAIAAALQIAPSCLSKWRKLRRETGALKPGKMNGHKKPVGPDCRMGSRAHALGTLHDPSADG